MLSQFEDRSLEPKAAAVYEDLFYTFVQANCRDRLIEIAHAEEKEKCVHPLLVTYIQLFNECPELGQDLLTFPKIVLPQCDKAARRAYTNVLQSIRDSETPPLRISGTKIIKVRVFSLPDKLISTQIPSVKDVGTFTCLRGTIVRSTNSQLLEYAKLYKCSVCKQSSWIECVVETFHSFSKSKKLCQSKCVGGKLTPVGEGKEKLPNPSTSKLKDYQEVKIQETDQKTGIGTARTIWTILEDDLVDACKPGDDVYICGTVLLRWKPQKVGKITETELALQANHIYVNNDQRASVFLTEETHQFFKDFWIKHQNDPYTGRNCILRSFCPEVLAFFLIYGMYVVKLAMCVVLAGGVKKQRNGSTIRGESHLLLVGDPGTGKSQFLKYTSKVCARTVLTTGIGTTNAGLTVYASKGGGDWHLEAGALVLADGGVCCIDEFSCIKEHDRVSIHEAMEQQSVTIAKAGMHSKLNTRCTIIAATNPKGKYDPNESLPLNVGIATPLLSRFDVLLVLRDAQNSAWDAFIADFILTEKSSTSSPSNSDLWDAEHMQAYFLTVKNLEPKMTAASSQVLSTYYEYQRKSATRNKSRTTVRLLESLVRLSEGHARLMYREEVTLHDVVTAITLVESSMLGSTLIGSANTLHTSFPEDPLKEYMNQGEIILNALGLSHFWQEEKRRLVALIKSRPPANPFVKTLLHQPQPKSFTARASNRAGPIFNIGNSQRHVEKRPVSPIEESIGQSPKRPRNEEPSPEKECTEDMIVDDASLELFPSPSKFTVEKDRIKSPEPDDFDEILNEHDQLRASAKRARLEIHSSGIVDVEDEISDFLNDGIKAKENFVSDSDEDFV